MTVQQFPTPPAPPADLDLAALLQKYIAHVAESEGVDFILSASGHSLIQFTPEEWSYLQTLSHSTGYQP